jgi:murein L,D-transpeptidase YcbB/YkuD
MIRFLVAVFILACASVPARGQVAWTRSDAAELLSVADSVDAEGLDPADYDVRALRERLASAEGGWDALSSQIFLRLASDLYQGHVRGKSAVAWWIAGPAMTEDERLKLLASTLARHDVAATLRGLVPRNAQYRRLKAALASTPRTDVEAVRRLRANLERWRWMPRELGKRYLLVNVPAFTVTMVEEGRADATRRVIVGKRVTPTPQFSTTATGAIFNPWWDVPDSIVRESVGRLVRTQPAAARAKGYVVQGGRYRQRPGPDNALGQVKLVMPNPYRVYLHDTPTRALFDRDERALSHGCIRTQDVVSLVRELLAGTDGWTAEEIDAALARGHTVQADFARPLPVYVTYFTAAVDEAGHLVTYPDVYRRDEPIIAALTDREAR